MDKSSKKTIDDASDSVEVQTCCVGAVLREAREQFGLSVADVESRLKFASHQIEALEADNFILLPEPSFVRRFVRSYAKLLQLDPEPLLASLALTPAQPSLHTAKIAIEVPMPKSYMTRRLKIFWLASGIVVAIILALFVWLNRSQPIAPQVSVDTVEMPTVTSTEIALPLSDAAVVPLKAPTTVKKTGQTKLNSASKQSGDIRLMFDAESWVKVTDKDGKILLAKLNLRGSEKYLQGKPPYSVVIGNVDGVRLYYHGKLVEFAPSYPGGIANLKLE